MSETAATRSLEMLKQVSSTGYLRKRLPQELVVLQGGQSTGTDDALTALNTLVPATSGAWPEARWSRNPQPRSGPGPS